jgi:fibronectin type 3 domain-containing protein
LPVTIPAGGSQGFMVTFTPQAVGTASASLYFLDSGASPLAVEWLTGTGTVSQGGHSVDLSWNASTSQDVIGYNVYRGTRSGGPYSKINSVLDPNLAYTDVSVTDGMTYYYVTTAVDSDNQESVYSNQAQAIIP